MSSPAKAMVTFHHFYCFASNIQLIKIFQKNQWRHISSESAVATVLIYFKVVTASAIARM